MIAKCWILLGNIEKSEYWALKAYQFRKSRAEPIYFLTNLFRDRSQHYKAYHYYRIGKSIPESFDSLFVIFGILLSVYLFRLSRMPTFNAIMKQHVS